MSQFDSDRLGLWEGGMCYVEVAGYPDEREIHRGKYDECEPPEYALKDGDDRVHTATAQLLP
jgi:hypothetical protein